MGILSFGRKKYRTFQKLLKTQGATFVLVYSLRRLRLWPQGKKQLEDDYPRWLKLNTRSADHLSTLAKTISDFSYQPLISVVMPVYNIEIRWLKKALESVQSQIYQNWELICVDDCSTWPQIKPYLQKVSKEDTRIKPLYLAQNQRIAGASNRGLEICQGEYICFLDHDDALSPDALFEIVKALQTEVKADLLYSDEDIIDENDKRFRPHLKPDFSPTLLWSYNYICHLAAYRSNFLLQLGGLRPEFDGAQDFDLVLRFTEKFQNIVHIPHILYHWRALDRSTASSIEAKPYAVEAGKKAIEQSLLRQNIQGSVQADFQIAHYHTHLSHPLQPPVTLIIPFKDKVDYLKVLLESFYHKTTYPHYKILLLSNNSVEEATREFQNDCLKKHPDLLWIDYNIPFNFSALMNYGVELAQTELVLLLNNDMKIITPSWLDLLVGHMQRPNVGAVGAKLLYDNQQVQHAGVMLMGKRWIAGHPYHGCPDNEGGYMGRSSLSQDYSAVTAACLLTRKSLWQKVGGMDEPNLSVAFNDVDYCLKLRKLGLQVVFEAQAKLFHFESISRGYEETPEKISRFAKEADVMRKRWGKTLDKDPYWNPNLCNESQTPVLRMDDLVL